MRGNTIRIELPLKRGKVSKTIPLYQYDYGQKLIITGAELPEYYEVHFSNEMHGDAVTSIGDSTGVLIPDALLATGENVYLWLYLHADSDDGETEFQGAIPVIKRAQVTDQTPTPAEQSVITQAIAALTAASAEATEAKEDAEAAQQHIENMGVASTTLPTGSDATVTKTVDASGEVTLTFGLPRGVKGDRGDRGLQGETGNAGEDGEDGFSPVVSLTKSGKVTTFSVTDAEDTYSVEINDGEDGNPGQDATPDLITVDYSDLTFPVAAGTMCYHSGLLYKANQAIATSEEWTAAHWTQTTIEEEHLSLKTEITKVKDGTPGGVPSINRLNLLEVAENKYINYETGELIDNNDDNTTGFIKVTQGKDAVAFSGKSAYNDNRVCLPIIRTMFYDESKNIIGHKDNTASNNVCTLATGTVYVRLACAKSYYSGRYPMVEFVDSKNDISTTYVEYSEGTPGTHGAEWAIDTVEDLLSDEKIITELGTFANGSINSGTGAYQNWNNYRVATPDIITASEDYILDIDFGFRVFVFYFDSQGAKVYSGWAHGQEDIAKGSIFRLMIGRTTEDVTETADVATFCSKVHFIPKANINNLIKKTDNNNAVSNIGMTWDWWITANSIDAFGNVYIGYVSSDGYAGVLRRQPDGVMQYKRLEKSNDNDDHNGMATIVLDDGRILVIGSFGHSINNHIICWRSQKPFSIDEMEKLSFDITGDEYTYKTCYSQVFKYDGKLFDFMRFGSCPTGGSFTYGYACLISEDNGTTWTPYKVFNGTDAYQGIAQATDNEKYLKVVVASNPAGGNHTFKGCYIDLSTYKIYDLNDTEIGEMVELNGGAITDESCPTELDMTVITEQTVTGSKGRLFFTGRSELAKTIFLYATADDAQDSNFTYKLYNDGNVVTIGKSGTPFGNHHYLSGMCFGNDTETIYYATSTDSNTDGSHELHKVKISNNAVDTDLIITEASMCIIRPLFLGNGEVAVAVGHYNDPEQSGDFLSWQLKPLFVHA